jgi:hypothetical protein
MKGEVERMAKLSREETEMVLKQVEGQFMNALKHQEKLIQANRHRISSGKY